MHSVHASNLRRFVVVLVFVAACAAGAAAQSTPGPSGPSSDATAPAGSVPTFQATAPPTRPPRDATEHRAYVTCSQAPFYYWEPQSGSEPTRASYPPAKFGDTFGVVGKPVLTKTGLILYQTTIPVLPPYGAGKWYWVPQSCLNVV